MSLLLIWQWGSEVSTRKGKKMQTENKQTCSFCKQSFKTKSVQVAIGNNEHIKEQKSDSY